MHSPQHVIRLLLTCAVFFTVQNSFAQAVGDYQSVGTGGAWNALATWNTWNGTSWIAAVATPTNASGVITISTGTTVTITAAVAFDEVIVNGALTTTAGVQPTLQQGTGVDLTINGTFTDNNATANQMVWTAGATWLMGATGTLIKTGTSSSNNWQSNYSGGITNIPATSFWIIRRNALTAIPMSSTTPASGSVYPNLTIENNAAAWITPAGSSFTGTTINVTVKGNLDIGGAGSNTVDFLMSNTHANPTVVWGNVLIRTGSSIRNYGTGLEVRGNLTVNGSITYDANDARRIIFGGGNAQNVSGTGALNVWDLTFSKSAGAVTLSRVVTVNNLATFTWGVVNTTATNLLIIAAAGTVAGANPNSFVDGPVRYLGNSAFTFPTGDASDYQGIGISGYVPVGAIWTEPFSNGCTQLCLANGYNGWSVVSTGTNGTSANEYFLSCQENGNAAGACGSGCGADASLHIGNVSTSPAAFLFCPTGDCGAAYDGGVGSGTCLTSKRAQSPAINCTGYSNLVVSFNYMEGGDGLNDNALLWYFDGATWSLLVDLPKTVLCAGQGTWTAYTASLPASANNNPNVRIGFQWVNNDDGAGSDPSFAVDDVSLSVVEYFTAQYFYTNPQVPYGSTVVPSLLYLSSCEYWTLDRIAGSSTSTSVTLAWDANSCPVWALNDLRVARYDGVSTWQDEGNTATTGTTAAGTVTSGVVTTFSPFTLAAITTNPLPVVLTTFDAWYDSGSSQLEWITSSEINNDYFTVERANADGEYIPIGRVDGHGTTSQPNHYRFTDTDPYEGINYYRLRQFDYNGQYEYSPVRIVMTEETTALDILSISTVGGYIDVSVVAPEGVTVQTQITDVSGRVVYSDGTIIHHQPTHFVTSSLTAGVYFIEVSDGRQRIIRKIQLLTE